MASRYVIRSQRKLGFLHMHIDAAGVIKRSSFDHSGVTIDNDGVIAALKLLSDGQEKTI
jgi:hypothetical protein